jgi:hypothetical protein
MPTDGQQLVVQGSVSFLSCTVSGISQILFSTSLPDKILSKSMKCFWG